MANRRSFLQSALGIGAGLFAAATPAVAQSASAALPGHRSQHTATPPVHTPVNTPVITTDVGDLPFTLEDGFKVFRLTAHVMQRQIAPDKTIDVWGFNGSTPGPTIQVTQGDRVRVLFHNQLPEATSLHWHGFEDLIGFDGMPGISQEAVKPGERFTYEFDIHQEGTYFYHSHMAMQEMAGMLGAFIMHPKVPYTPHCDKDFVIHLQEYSVLPNSTVPNTMNMEYNWLVLNGKSGPSATPLIVRQGERVRVRFINLGMDHHPMHIHGHTFQVTGTEGGRIQQSAWWPGNTVLVGVAQARDIEFVANNPGDWMLHCHLPHHMMNQMSSQAALPGALDTTMTNGPLSDAEQAQAMQGMQAQMQTQMQAGKPANGPLQMQNMMAMNMDSGMSMQAARQQQRETSPNAGNVPNFPQDAYMEGPMMQMDQQVEKPENYGLRPGWSRYMQGMMTFIRVLPAPAYNDVLTRMRQANRPGDPYATILDQNGDRNSDRHSERHSASIKPLSPRPQTVSAILLLLLLATPSLLRAQQSAPAGTMQNMPGMTMSPDAKPAPPQSAPLPTPPSDAPTAQSLQNSAHQQAAQQGVTPGPQSDAPSITLPTLHLQEQENPALHTGQTLPAPQLLVAVLKRTPLSLQFFLAASKHLNPTLAQAQSTVDRSRQQARQMGLYPNPSIGYSGEHIRGGSYQGGEQGAYVQQQIVLGGKLGLRRNIGEQQARSNSIAVDEQQYRVQNAVQQAFYRALASQAMVAVQQQLVQVALNAATTAHRLANVGQADAPDILQSEVQSEQAAVDSMHAQRQYLQDFAQLAALSGQPELPPAPLDGDFEHPPQLDAQQQVESMLNTSPAIQQAQQQIELADARLKDATHEAIPDLTIRAGEWWSGEQLAGSAQAAGPMSFLDAGITLPLWNRNQGNVAAAKAERERARLDVTRARLELRQAAEPLAQDYLTAQFEADRYRTEMLPRAERSYQLYLMKYQQMATAYPQVLVSQQVLFQLQLSYLKSLARQWSTALALENYTLMGGLTQQQSSGSDTTMTNTPNAKN